jgi:hypothetical protein
MTRQSDFQLNFLIPAEEMDMIAKGDAFSEAFLDQILAALRQEIMDRAHNHHSAPKG